ncbi:hypothetical protein LINPERHAP2_LOCUS14220 [Linum perenne]
MILSAIGKDGNNQMFPIAWAVVESENKHSWKWILELLQEELQLDDGTGWSVISDQQKVCTLQFKLVKNEMNVLLVFNVFSIF